MQDKNIYGILKNKKLDINLNKNNYIDNKDIFIALDGRYNEKDYIKKIKDLYIKYGEKFIYKIDDFFSLYLYDKKKNILIISRDRMGSKTVYYYMNNNCICFSNDIMSLMDNYKIKREINKECLNMYFSYHFIDAPETIFKNVYKLNHGDYLIYKNNILEINNYWSEIDSFNNNSKKLIKNKKEIKEELNRLLEKSIKDFLSTNDNIGIYMSSGIDSSLVTALSTKYSNKKIKTFSIGFHNEIANEAVKAKAIANYIGTDHTELYIEDNQVKDIIKKIPKYYTEPFGDPSAFPTIVLNELARENGIKTVITGDGADQLFCGSNVYDKLKELQLARRIFNPFNLNINFKNKKLKHIFRHIDKGYESQSDVEMNSKILNNLFIDNNGKKRFDQESKIKTNNWQERRMILDIGTFMADRVSIKMGIATKKNNIEMKTPFFCKDFIEYTFRIPHNLKYHNRIKKYILKDILYDIVPESYFSSKKKGFGIPLREWITTYLYEDIKNMSKKDFIEKQNIFNYDELLKIINNVDERNKVVFLWDYYMFQLWYKEYI